MPLPDGGRLRAAHYRFLAATESVTEAEEREMESKERNTTDTWIPGTGKEIGFLVLLQKYC